MAQLAGIASPAQHLPVHGHSTADTGARGEHDHVIGVGRGAQSQLREQGHVGIVVEDDVTADYVRR